MTAAVINFGSINVDYIYRVSHFVAPGETLSSLQLTTVLGGKGANQSVAIARAGVAVEHIGRISKTDGWAEKLMSDSGVDTQRVELVEQPSGHAIIQVDNHGENAIVLHGGANQSFDYAAIESAISATDAEYLLLQNECNLLAEAIDLGVAHGKNIVFNPAPMTEDIKALPLTSLHTLIVNQGEAESLCGKSELDEMVAALSTLLPETLVVITLGGDGAILLTQGEVIKCASPRVEVIDTTGAGDTFVGYFVAGLVADLELETSLQRACKAASIAVTRSGAIPSIPAISELG